MNTTHRPSRHVPARTGRTPLEALERRALMAGPPPVPTAAARSYDGSGNNVANPTWGATGATLIRLAQAAYADGKSAPAGSARPSARAISNAVSDHPDDVEIRSAKQLSAFAYLWGQFIDHDLDLTTSASPAEAFNVSVPTGDPSFDPLSTGTQVIPLSRSKYASGTGVANARQQVNDITGYLDGSMVYGSDAARAAALRTFVGGRMLTSAGGLLPFNTAGLSNANDAHLFAASELFLAGDVRANENSELTALQTLFVREHNRLAGLIATQHAGWTDEQIYQQTRRLVIGEIENITYNEYLPALLGTNAVGRYAGYDPRVNVGVSNEFSTAGFRLGHSQLVDDVEFITNDGEDAQADMSLAQVFFNPTVVEGSGIDTILKYLSSSNSEEIDLKVVDSVRNFLFGPPGAGGLDLVSLNIQRGRDHGLADYNTTRAALGLPRVTSFGQITSDATLAANLQALYGSVDDVDLWVGGLAENHVSGSNLGATFQRIIVDQFTRARAGDRFWYERDLTGNDLANVRATPLSDIISANTTMSNLQDNVFVFDVQVSGRVFDDRNHNGRQESGERSLAGVSVQLWDEDGDLDQTVITASNGAYRFTGLQIGDYVAKPVAGGAVAVPPTLATAIDVTRGRYFNGVDFGVTAIAQPQFPPTPRPHGPDRDANLVADLIA